MTDAFIAEMSNIPGVKAAAKSGFVIGGADGLSGEVIARADTTLSFGRMVWPHMIARVMLAEQIYRAATIAVGSPYHRV